MTAQHPDDILAMRMMETARLERKRAAERDGVHPGGLETCKRPGPKSYRVFSEAGAKARALIAQNPSLTAKELAALSGIGERGARHVMRTSGIAPAAPARSPAGVAARRIMATEPGVTAADLAKRSGLSISAARELWRSVRGEQRNGAPRSKAGIEAERLAREGRNASEIVAVLGVSRQMARRAVQRAQA